MIKRIICIFTLFCLSISLIGCSDYKHIEPTDEDLTVVGHVNGREVYLEELRFVTHTYHGIMTARYGEDIFDGADKEKYLSMLRELVYKNITYGYAVIELCEDVGISLGEKAVLRRVDLTLSDMVKNELGSFSKYKKYLRKNHLTDHFLRFSTEISLLENELMYVYVDDLLLIEDDDEKIYDTIKDEFIVVRHVFIPHTAENAKQTIDSVLERCKNGADMSSLISEYDQDPDMTDSGIFILDGYMTDEYEKIAFSLDVGQISEIVTDDNGYYVIERMEMSPSAIMLDFDNLKKTYQTYTFYSMIDEKQASLTFVPNDSGIDYMSDPFSK